MSAGVREHVCVCVCVCVCVYQVEVCGGVGPCEQSRGENAGLSMCGWVAECMSVGVRDHGCADHVCTSENVWRRGTVRVELCGECGGTHDDPRWCVSNGQNVETPINVVVRRDHV